MAGNSSPNDPFDPCSFTVAAIATTILSRAQVFLVHDSIGIPACKVSKQAEYLCLVAFAHQ